MHQRVRDLIMRADGIKLLCHAIARIYRHDAVAFYQLSVYQIGYRKNAHDPSTKCVEQCAALELTDDVGFDARALKPMIKAWPDGCA